MGLGFIGWKTLPNKSSAAGRQAGRKSTGEEDGKRREQEILLNLGKKTEPEENNNFKPALSPHIQAAADRLKAHHVTAWFEARPAGAGPGNRPRDIFVRPVGPNSTPDTAPGQSVVPKNRLPPAGFRTRMRHMSAVKLAVSQINHWSLGETLH